MGSRGVGVCEEILALKGVLMGMYFIPLYLFYLFFFFSLPLLQMAQTSLINERERWRYVSWRLEYL